MSGIVEYWQDTAHACEAHYNQTANFLPTKYPIVHNCVSGYPSFLGRNVHNIDTILFCPEMNYSLYNTMADKQ